MASGEAGRLYQVMAAMARPVRLTRGKHIDAAWSVQVGGSGPRGCTVVFDWQQPGYRCCADLNNMQILKK